MGFYNSNQSNIRIMDINSQANRGVGHWKIEVSNTSITAYFEGTLIPSTSDYSNPVSVDFGNSPVRIGFVGISSSSSTIKIANFKEYYG